MKDDNNIILLKLNKLKPSVNYNKLLFIMKTLIATTAFVASTEGRFQWGWCPSVPRVENFNYTKFEGTWYEIYRDKDHHAISNQQCTVDTY